MNARVEAEAAVDDPLRRWATIGLLAAVAIRTLVATGFEARFDVDPAVDPTPFAGLGPFGSWMVDLLLLFASGLALFAERRVGRGIDGPTVALAFLPALPVLFHGLSDAADLHRGGAWLSAAAATAAAAHLARDPASRRLLAVGLVAIVLPLVAKGLVQGLVEHPRTVAFFEANRTAFLAERGWDPDGPAAANFERRLRQVEATGWFGLANLVSALAACATVGLVGCAAVARGRTRAVLAAGALAAATLVFLNFSKGAVVATGLGVAFLLVGRGGNLRRVALAIVACVALAFLAAPLRGALEWLAPGAIGERSLLFRSQYLEGGLRILVHAIPLGIGPEGVQAAYLLEKSPRAPEDVTSLHAVFADWLLTLGPLGLAWAALALRLVLSRAPDGEESPGAGVATTAAATVAFALVASLLAAAYAEPFLIDGSWLLVRCGGSVAAIAVAAAAARALAGVAPGRTRLVALAMAGTLLVLGQVEMVFFAVGPVAFAGVALGVAAALPARRVEGRAGFGAFAATQGTLAACAAAIVVLGAIPQRRADAFLDRAAAEVAPLADLRERWPAIRTARPGSEVLAALEAEVAAFAGGQWAEAVREAGAIEDPAERVARLAATLEGIDAAQRTLAYDWLAAAAEAHPRSSTPIAAAIRQLAAAGRRVRSDRSGPIRQPALHDRAVGLARDFAAAWPGPRSAALLADLALDRAVDPVRRPTSAPPDFRDALDAARIALARQPHAPSRILDVADLAAATGDLALAAERYRVALAADAALAFDPVVQWSPARRAEVEARLARVEAGDLPAGWPFVDGPRSPLSSRP